MVNELVYKKISWLYGEKLAKIAVIYEYYVKNEIKIQG